MPENTVKRNPKEVAEHASYITLGEKWVSACDLEKGDKVLLSEGKYGIVKEVKTKECKEYITYNFEVEDYHTYYVGKNSVLVHNAGCKVNKFSVKEDGITVKVNPGENIGNVSHNTPHAHVTGKGPNTTVGLDGSPMKGHRTLSNKQSKMIKRNWEQIEEIIRKVWPQ